MRGLARAHGYPALVAPVRPTWKERYPLIPMERYAGWTRDDGLPFDPWLRVHAKLGAELLEVCPASMRIEGSVEEWEDWTGLVFPDDGDYPSRARSSPCASRTAAASTSSRTSGCGMRPDPDFLP